MPFGRVAVWWDGARRLSPYICRLMIYPARSSPLPAMALVATVIALQCVPARAAADAKPCRTPCLSVNVPREPAEKPAEKTPEKAPEPEPKPAPALAPAAVARPAAKPRPPTTAQAATASQDTQREPIARRPAPSRRCGDINMRAAIGEPLSDQDMKTLRSQC